MRILTITSSSDIRRILWLFDFSLCSIAQILQYSH